MRFMGSLPDMAIAQRFVRVLAHEGIEAAAESCPGQSARIWVVNEDEVERAQELFARFQADPEAECYQVDNAPQEPVITELPVQPPSRGSRVGWGWVTTLLSSIMVVIFFLAQYQYLSLLESTQGRSPPPILLVPIAKALMIDAAPQQRALLAWEQEQGGAPPPVPAPMFHGILGDLSAETNEEAGEGSAPPLLPDVFSGQIWRLWTPALLHLELLHLVFNLMWFIYLGRQVEYRLGSLRMLVLVGIVALCSNLAQYAMSGPSFLGLSGVDVGLAGYIWVRTKKCPWEGYPIPQMLLRVLGVLIVGGAVVSGVGLLLHFLDVWSLPMHIANTAHIVGGLTGILLGHSRWMERRFYLGGTRGVPSADRQKS